MKPLLQISPRDLESFGIVDWGYTTELKSQSYKSFTTWLIENHEALPYLGTQQSIHHRADTSSWFPEAQSAIVFLFDYTPAKKELLGFPKVASYALAFDGQDYHVLLKRRLHELAALLGLKDYKLSLDTQPIMERDLAFRAGLGWFGKNAMLIHPQHGSYFLIGSLILSQKLALDTPASLEPDHCGNCRACVDACPTQAIDVTTRTLSAKKCISTWTIEDHREDTPSIPGLETARGEIFGCDICQDVCPWNRKPLERVTGFLGEQARHWRDWYHQSPKLLLETVQGMSGRAVERFFSDTPFMRSGKKTLVRVLKFWLKHDPEDGSHSPRS